MYYYYLFTILVSWLYFFSNRLGQTLIFICIPIFLVALPTTGADYDFYELSYVNASFSAEFPFFYSRSILTAEPLYVWYTSLISVITQVSFPAFLAINFLLCSFIINYNLKKIARFNINLRSSFWLYITPIIIPTIFYFSPRSSISFCFILSGFFILSFRHKMKLGAILMFIGFSFHSQYLLVSLYILTLYLVQLKQPNLRKGVILKLNLILAALLLLFLLALPYLESIISSLFSFLPSASVAVSKLHYISDDIDSSTGFRLTSILSIIIYPIVALMILNKYNESENIINKTFLFMIIGLVFFSLIVNIVFINEPHVAGRLSRFSDYFSMGFMIPYCLYIYRNQILIKITALVMCIISPLIFKTLYSNASGIL